MRYKVSGLEIRSENAAKPACCAGTWMLNWISCLRKDETGLDLGCGKLRYTVHLAGALASVTAVDSALQVDRTQTLFGLSASVRAYAIAHLPNVRVCALEEDAWQRDRYAVVLCSNVLSAIPSRRVRKRLVATAYRLIAIGGTFLLTTQYRNSHFSGWKSNPQAYRYCDGFLVRTARGASFYGLIDSVALTNLCRSAGFSVVKAGHEKELAYVIATK